MKKKSLKLTSIEAAVKSLLEKAGIQVFKGSYPDFVIYNPDNKKYCLVEVKAHSADKPSENQKATLEVLKKLGIPCHVIHADSVKDLLDLENLMGMKQTGYRQFLTKMERERFDAMARFDSVKAAALSLGLSPSTLYNWRNKCNKRYEYWRGKTNAYLAQTRRGGSLTILLHKKQKMKPPEPDDWEAVADLPVQMSEKRIGLFPEEE